MSIQGKQDQVLRHTSSQEGQHFFVLLAALHTRQRVETASGSPLYSPLPQLLALPPIFYSLVPLPSLDNTHTESRIGIGMGIWSPTKKGGGEG